VVLVELIDAVGAERLLGRRALESTLQRLVEDLQERLSPGDSVDRVTGSHELIAVLRGGDTSTTLRHLTEAVTVFERETGLRVLCGEAPSASAQEQVMAVYLRAEIAMTKAKDLHFAALAA
jgi:hypothetical protein